MWSVSNPKNDRRMCKASTDITRHHSTRYTSLSPRRAQIVVSIVRCPSRQAPTPINFWMATLRTKNPSNILITNEVRIRVSALFTNYTTQIRARSDSLHYRYQRQMVPLMITTMMMSITEAPQVQLKHSLLGTCARSICI